MAATSYLATQDAEMLLALVLGNWQWAERLSITEHFLNVDDPGCSIVVEKTVFQTSIFQFLMAYYDDFMI